MGEVCDVDKSDAHADTQLRTDGAERNPLTARRRKTKNRKRQMVSWRDEQ
jgi:hypothetical protein